MERGTEDTIDYDVCELVKDARRWAWWRGICPQITMFTCSLHQCSSVSLPVFVLAWLVRSLTLPPTACVCLHFHCVWVSTRVEVLSRVSLCLCFSFLILSIAASVHMTHSKCAEVFLTQSHWYSSLWVCLIISLSLSFLTFTSLL